MNARSNSNARFTIHRLQVAQELHQFIEDQVLPGTGIESAHFWAGFDAIVADLAPKNRALLAERDRLQTELDAWHRAHPGPITDMPAYRAFLEQIAYLVPQPAAQVTTANVDAELAQQAGPQLVVPITNARYALNAANARWGSLYDALYGTDAIPETDGAQKGKGYNPVRGAKVIAFARDFLDQSAPLAAGSPHDSTGYAVVDGARQVTLKDGSVSGLKHPAQLAVLDRVAGGVRMAARGQRGGLVEHAAREGDDLSTTHRVVASGLLGAAVLGDRIGAVERVVQAAPARIRGVEGIARVHDRHHQLRAALRGDLGIDVGGADLEGLRQRLQVTDLGEESLVRGHVPDRAGVRAVPVVERRLQPVSLGQQGGVLRCEVGDDGVEADPERVGGDPGAGQHLLLDEVGEDGGDVQALAAFSA